MTATATARTRIRSLPLAALGACLLSFAAFWAAQRAAHVSMLDLSVYRAEGETVLAGGDLYAMRATSADLPMTYPPFAALLFIPLTLVGTPEMRTLATLGNLLLLVALAHLSLRLVAPGGTAALRRDGAFPTRPGAALWAAAVLVWCEPVWQTFRYGQVNLLMAVAVLWDLTRRADSRWTGVGIGFATAVKLTPGLFVVLLLAVGVARARSEGWAPWRNEWLRRGTRAVAVFSVVTAVSALVLPYDSRRFWTETIFETSRVGRTEETANQSLSGVLARLLHTTDPGAWWVVAAALVGVAGLAVAVLAALRGDRAVAVVACAVTALLVSPISWSHHWVWCVPALLLLATRVRPVWTAGTALVFGSFALWWVPHAPAPVRLELHQNGWQMLLSGLYTLLGIALLGAFAAWVARAGRGGRPGAGVSGAGRAQAVANE
ncbi:glycosyltransferase 87 family protein [Streptomyces somaliensis]|uniref:glycosyltransferase 87 family protein n=1 Tax=Streptomyces somaliensis TaxID=78355 RepID=UPI0020CCD466|nr:glycosyltransferase 87 family protein [Streptomyces somaliensis]MCP9945873.1 glycosyltransferase 87 family protein [Streptomyces somaliensis]MCP9960952.1 glycosyltransferase 87 family protein [Streptomyces somaliensis]MCP9973740.1 glycosyltransferase 87 family protein [Streptomyces somaliensis]